MSYKFQNNIMTIAIGLSGGATMSKEGFLIYNVIASKLKVTSQVSNDSILKDINM